MSNEEVDLLDIFVGSLQIGWDHPLDASPLVLQASHAGFLPKRVERLPLANLINPSLRELPLRLPFAIFPQLSYLRQFESELLHDR